MQASVREAETTLTASTDWDNHAGTNRYQADERSGCRSYNPHRFP
ncbi:MAG: hypothetical protein V7642_1872 [Burkholderiales bacterium]